MRSVPARRAIRLRRNRRVRGVGNGGGELLRLASLHARAGRRNLNRDRLCRAAAVTSGARRNEDRRGCKNELEKDARAGKGNPMCIQESTPQSYSQVWG